ncbi:hypothetical protein [Fretibacter rubidus]|uniref:hypothetical protein n=1 Tax=Fretibacter rubidus TaxID=570162 RepID=UPI00352B5351
MNDLNDKTVSPNKARAGRRVKGMTIVLALSTIAAVIILMLVFAGNAAAFYNG